MSFSVDEQLEAIDGAIMHLVTLRRILANGSGEVREEAPVEPWQEPCPDSPQGSRHEVLWAREGRTGMCRTCGAEFELPAPA